MHSIGQKTKSFCILKHFEMQIGDVFSFVMQYHSLSLNFKSKLQKSKQIVIIKFFFLLYALFG